MNDTVRRAVRTFIQGAVGIFAILAVPFLGDLIESAKTGGELNIDMNLISNILVACAAGGVIALVSFVQNWLEDTTGKTLISK